MDICTVRKHNPSKRYIYKVHEVAEEILSAFVENYITGYPVKIKFVDGQCITWTRS